MASNVEFGNKYLRRVAIVAFLGALGGAAVSSCADSDTVTTGGSNTTSSGSSSGSGGEGNAGGKGGAGGVGVSSSSSSSSSGSMGGSGGGGSGGGSTCVPTEEVCDGKDNDCNGTIDDAANGCDCVTGQTQNCYTGPTGTQDTGICKGGTQTCDANGKWGLCEGEILPAAAESCEGTDETCDGNVDEGCACTAGQTQSCYTGPMGTENTGVCKPGTQTCDTTGAWGDCVGAVTPSPEMCNGLDDDCNGAIDNDNPGGGDMCTATGVLGECRKGTLNCVNGSVKCTPAPIQPEVCDGLDNNCEGTIDEGSPGVGMQCPTGLMGICATGLTVCEGMNGIVCKANVMPGQNPEACNGLDDDCDGFVDDNIAQVGQMCTKPGQLGVCQFGTFECPMGATQIVCNAPLPGTIQETCNGKDDDCNGTIDDPILVNNQPCSTMLPGVCSTGLTICSLGSQTCNPTVMPGSQTEICDSKDNDCNGQSDEMNPTPACTTQNPMAGGVSTWACTMGACQIQTCALGQADIDGAPGNGCECQTDQHANSCIAAGSLSVPKGGTANMTGKVESAMGSDWITFNFIAPGSLGQSYAPKVQLVNNAGGQYAMDVMLNCMSLATCNDGGTGTDVSVWELNYQYNQNGNPKGPWSDNDPKIVSVKVRVYRRNGTQPTCDQYTVTATNP